MKRIILTLALMLAACGGAGDEEGADGNADISKASRDELSSADVRSAFVELQKGSVSCLEPKQRWDEAGAAHKRFADENFARAQAAVRQGQSPEVAFGESEQRNRASEFRDVITGSWEDILRTCPAASAAAEKIAITFESGGDTYRDLATVARECGAGFQQLTAGTQLLGNGSLQTLERANSMVSEGTTRARACLPAFRAAAAVLGAEPERELLAAPAPSRKVQAPPSSTANFEGCSVGSDRSIKKVIEEFCSSYFEGADEDGRASKVQNTAVFRRDFDGDGDNDAVVAFNSCEADRCHTTTRTTTVLTLKNSRSTFRSVSGSDIHTVSGWARLADSTSSGPIFETKTYGPDDPDCCPSQVQRVTLPFG